LARPDASRSIPQEQGGLRMRHFKASLDITRCLNGSQPAWDRLAAWINTELRRYCEHWLACRGIKDTSLAEEACARVLESLPDQTEGRLRKYLTARKERPTAASWLHFASALARGAMVDRLRGERRIHQREMKAVREDVQGLVISEAQVLACVVEGLDKVSTERLAEYWNCALEVMPAELRGQPMSSAQRKRRFEMMREFRKLIATGQVGGDLPLEEKRLPHPRRRP